MGKPCFNATVLMLAATLDQDDDSRASALVELGYSDAEACRLLAFVPSAFARPILEKLGVTDFPDESSIPLENGDYFTFFLTDQPEFLMALTAARIHFARGVLPHAAYQAIAFSSAELNVISQALDKGVDVRGGAVASAFIDRRLCEIVIRR